MVLLHFFRSTTYSSPVKVTFFLMKNSLHHQFSFLEYLSKYLRFMYKKQVNKVVRPTSVIVGFKKTAGTGAKAVVKSKKFTTIEKSEKVVEKTKVSNNHVNSKIHFHQDVPEEVQAFIKRISSEPADINKSPHSDPNLLDVKDKRQSRRVSLPCTEDEEDLVDLSRKSSIPVIVTADYSPNNLTNKDYDKLKQVR